MCEDRCAKSLDLPADVAVGRQGAFLPLARRTSTPLGRPLRHALQADVAHGLAAGPADVAAVMGSQEATRWASGLRGFVRVCVGSHRAPGDIPNLERLC